jgi:hypothetical protein
MANLALEPITGFALTNSGSVFVATMRIAFPSTVVQLLVGSSSESLIFRAKGRSVSTLKFFDFAVPDRSEPTGEQ